MSKVSDIVKSIMHPSLKVIRGPESFSPPLLSDWMANAAIQPKWLIKDYLPADSGILISGPPKLGKKSYLAFKMALCVASGMKVGVFESAIGGPAPVLILEAEGGVREAYQRIKRICNGDKIDYNALPLYFSHREKILLTKPDWAEAVAKFVREKGCRLVVVDTMRMYMGGNENDSQDFSFMGWAINEIRQAGASVLFLHHVNKSSEPNRDPDSEIRGSSAIAGFYDVHYAIRHKENQNFETVLIRSKDDGDRYFEIFWTFTGEGDDEAATFELVPVSAEKRLAKAADEILMALSANERPTQPHSLRNSLKFPEGLVDEALDYLLKLGRISKTGRGYLPSRGGLDGFE